MSKISAYTLATTAPGAGDVTVFDVGGVTKRVTTDLLAGIIDQAAATGNTVTTTTGSDLTLATINLGAGQMGANGRIELHADFTYTNSANVKTLKVKLGSTTLWSATPTTTAGLRLTLMLRNRNAQNAQRWSAQHVLSSGTVGDSVGTAAVDTSVATTITITAQLAVGTDSVTLEGRDVVLYAKA